MTALPQSSSTSGTSRSLRAVAAGARPVSAPLFAAIVAGILALGMVSLLVLTTALQNQAFAVQEAQTEAVRLANDASDLEAEVARARSVEALAIAAQELGMKPNPYPAQLRLPDGSVVGRDEQVMGGELPSVRYQSEEQAAAEEKARQKAEKKRAEQRAAAAEAARAERKAGAESQ